MKKVLITLLALLSSLSICAQTIVKYSDSDDIYKIKDAVVKVDHGGPYIVIELDNGAKIFHSNIGGYNDAKELATDLLNSKSTLRGVQRRGWAGFSIK